MRTIGLLGGMSWESSIGYERLINEGIRDALGGTNSADLIIRSFNFADIESLQIAGKWEEAGNVLANAARKLEDAGAEAILICANTMHVLAEQVEDQISIPLLHIADAVGEAITAQKLNRVLLLGTRYTMEKDFYKRRLAAKYGLQVNVPEPEQRDEIHRIIYEELVRGVLLESSRQYLKRLIEKYADLGIEGVIAGCTEIELLVKQSDISVRYFPTTALHSEAAIRFALS